MLHLEVQFGFLVKFYELKEFMQNHKTGTLKTTLSFRTLWLILRLSMF